MKIAIDFDDTLFNTKTSTVNEDAVAQIADWKSRGHSITIFTARPDWDYPSVKAILEMALVDYDRIVCGKPAYDLLIDDRAERFKGWGEDYTRL